MSNLSAGRKKSERRSLWAAKIQPLFLWPPRLSSSKYSCQNKGYWDVSYMNELSHYKALTAYLKQNILENTVSQENQDSPKIMLSMKNSQFLPNQYETLSIWIPHEYLILINFRIHLEKIANFLIKAYFCQSPDLHVPECRLGNYFWKRKFKFACLH